MWFWLVVAIACALFVALIALGIWIVHFLSHIMDGF